ncbi:MAG: TIGR00282 family metallophosphoesterase [Firmicutes bacterium]|jgi:metallophosphoesterase (TIGR00282 family)|nr:TIGR00282 family metallophosphoesterase [Bacillota bacterium]
MRVLLLGDIYGRPGRKIVAEYLPQLREEYQPDLVIANGENAAGGFGLTKATAEELFSLGIHVLTSGNHIWDQKEMLTYIDSEARVLRPANYPPGVPGQGVFIHREKALAVINISGRVYMDDFDCPFRAMDQILGNLPGYVKYTIVDFHAEATSEKLALGYYLDGKVSAVVGTHTHVPTADLRILPGGTAYVTDLGMCGPLNGVLGVDREQIIGKFLTQMPTRFHVAKGPVQLWGVVVELDERGQAVKVNRVERYNFNI